MEWTFDRYGWRLETALSIDDLEIIVKKALIEEHFGFPSQINVDEVLQEKLGVKRPAYRIIGACHPPSADIVTLADPAIGLFLPCNVVVREIIGGGSEVAMIDVTMMMQMVNMPELKEVAEDIDGRMTRSRQAILFAL
ncbi:MAG: DUF302 domain-containing protein [Euryarchaeota archaeon]|jgi:uncharacterized protein (DUF302 family)|nr:DUF302 domain-containing protein [Euryarchaeota archaeon]MBT6644286.1 DUF302 domain-containing protein [Euryarchaeota archaeon]